MVKLKTQLKLIAFFTITLLSCSNKNNMVAIGQVNLPNNATGQLFKDWLISYNSGNTAIIGEFTRKYYHELLLQDKSFEAEEWVSYYKKFGSLVLYNFDSTFVDDNGVKWPINALLTNNDQSKWMRLKFVVGSKTNKIQGISFKSSSKPKEIKIKRVSDNELGKQIDEEAAKMMEKDEFSGVILVARKDKPFYLKAFGLANRDNYTANTFETQFNLASLSKMFTAVAICQLVQDGKLSFSDTLCHILPDYPNKEIASKITVHQLLIHTSGLGDIFTDEYFNNKDSYNNINDWYKTFVHYPLECEPGIQFRYSNAGYIVLGAIIERVSGLDYETYIKENITKPVGMTNTGFLPVYDDLADKALPYTYYATPGRRSESPTVYQDLTKGSSAGGVYSTANDILKFAEAFRNYSLLNKDMTELMINSKVKCGEGIPDYAYGCHVNKADGIRTIGHGGTTPGISTILEIYWEHDSNVIVLANCDPTAADDMASFIKERIKLK